MRGATGRGAGSEQAAGKVAWSGLILSIQPRIRLLRSYDERHHGYLGYVLRLAGTMAGEAGEFTVALGKGAQSKHRLQAGDELSGEGVFVADARTETADLYKLSKLQVQKRSTSRAPESLPRHGIPPELAEYRERGHRRLDARTYKAKCSTCIWGSKMSVVMILDHWKPDKKRYREETFCYGPLLCAHYASGPTRKVPGRSGVSWEEEDWIDEEAVSHRGPED